MGLWSSLVKGTRTALTYTANVLTDGLSAVIALRHAIPALTTPEPKKILRATLHVTTHKILPLILLHYVNSQLQTYAHTGQEDDENNSAWYDLNMLSAITAIDWAVWGVTHWAATELVVETLIIDTMAPAAFNDHKKLLPPSPDSPCVQQECNFKRRIKGDISETLILFLLFSMITSIRSLPYGGELMHRIASILSSGTLIMRSGKLDACSRHRTTHSETVLVLGAFYTTSNILIDKILDATIGMPPFLVYRTIQHFLLLWWINTAAHMHMPYVAPGTGTLPFDPIERFESAMREGTDILFAGITDKTIKLLKPVPGSPPYISLPLILKKITDALNHDRQPKQLLHEKHGGPIRFFRSQMPPIFRSTDQAITNPVVRIFWSDFQEFMSDILITVQKTSDPLRKASALPGVAMTVKKGLPEILFLQFGLPKKLTNFLITLNKEEDFRVFILALEQWFQWYKACEKKPLAEISSGQLAILTQGEHTASSIEAPTENESAFLMPEEMGAAKTAELDPSDIPQKIAEKAEVSFGAELFQRPRQRKSEQNDLSFSLPAFN